MKGTGRFKVLAFFALFVFATSVAASELATVTITTNDASSVESTSAVLNGTVNTGGAFAAVWFEWGSTTSLGMRSDVQKFSEGANVTAFKQALRNLQPRTAYYYRAVLYPGIEGVPAVLGEVKTFTTTGDAAPSVTVMKVTSSDATVVTTNSATLNGAIDPGGIAGAGWFEWGTTTALGTHTEVHTFNGSSVVTLTQSLTNLRPGTTYYFRAMGYRSGGASVEGDLRSFTTKTETPTTTLSIKTLDASAVSTNSVELRGVISGGPANVFFEWGPSSQQVSQTPSQGINAGNTANFAYSLTGLQPNTTYYFRAAGQASTGNAVRGETHSFTTGRVASTPPVTIPEVETGSIKSGYVIITPDAGSDAPTPTLTFGIVSGGAVQSQAGIIPTPMTTDASMYVEVIPSLGRNLGVAIANASGTAAMVRLTLRDEDGITIGVPANVSVPAHAQVAKFVNEMFGTDTIGTGFRGSLRLQSASPFAAVGMRFTGSVFSTIALAVATPTPGVPTRTLTAGVAANTPQVGVVGGATALIIPQFALAGGWSSQLALVNNTNSTITGRIDVFDTAGNPMAVKMNGEVRSTFTYSIPVGGTFLLTPRDANGQSPM